MSPWDILGWVFVALLSVPVIIICVLMMSIFYIKARKYILYLKTRNVTPREGQRWMQGKAAITIGPSYNGRITFRTNSLFWNEDEKSWKKRVRQRKMYLVSGGK